MRVQFQTKDSEENEQHDNGMVGVKMLNIEAGRARGAFPGNRPAARAHRAPARRRYVSHRDIHKKHNSHFLCHVLSPLISTFQYDKAPIMMFHSDSNIAL